MHDTFRSETTPIAVVSTACPTNAWWPEDQGRTFIDAGAADTKLFSGAAGVLGFS